MGGQSWCQASHKRRHRVSSEELLPDQVLNIPVVFLTDVFHQFTLQQHRMSGERPRLCVSLRVVDGVFSLQMTEIRPEESLDDVQGLSSRKAGLVDPGLAVKSNGVDDKSIAFPTTNGFSEPGGIRIFRMCTS